MAAAARLILSSTTLILCLFCLCLCDLDNSETHDFDFDDIPGSSHEFRIEIRAGKVECFYQKVRPGAELHVSFEVLRGADRNIDMYILDPNGNKFGQPQQWRSSGVIDKETEIEGDYRICLDNSISRFTAKLVYVYMIIYSEKDWDAYTADLENLEVAVKNFTDGIKKVDQKVIAMKRFQAISRQHVITDWYILRSNNLYVQYLSIISCIIIVSTSAVQTYFLRRLFANTKVTPETLKPRA